MAPLAGPTAQDRAATEVVPGGGAVACS